MQQTQDFNIRYLKEKDYPYVVEATRKIVDLVLPGEPFEEEKIRAIFEQALTNETHAGIVLVDPDDTAKGFILVSLEELYFHPTNVAICLSIWVEPSCRAHSMDMLRALQAWAKYKKASFVTLSSFTNLSPDNLNKVLSYFKYKPKEVVYWKEL